MSSSIMSKEAGGEGEVRLVTSSVHVGKYEYCVQLSIVG